VAPAQEVAGAGWHDDGVTARSIALFVAAAVAEIGGAYLVWVGSQGALWGVAFDGFHPDRADVVGALICLVGVAVIMYAR
jgi:small multidrug resistance family-3 protein